MNRNKPSILERQLIEQEKRILEVDLTAERSEAFKQFHFNHRQLHALFSDSRDATVIDILTRSYLKNLEYRLLCSDNPRKEMYYINESIAYIARKEQVATLLADPANQELLAFAILTSVRYASEGHAHPKRYHVGEILQQWLGVNVPKKTILSLKETVDLLYGPALWTLYRDDVKSDKDMLKYIVSSGFRPLMRKHPADNGIDMAALLEASL